MDFSEIRDKLAVKQRKIEQYLKLATNNPTIEVLMKTLRFEIKFAFIIALSSIFIFKLFPTYFSHRGTFIHILMDIWEKICYSILASTVFYFINQHIPKIEKKVSCYQFEVNTARIVIAEIHDLLRRSLGDNISYKELSDPTGIHLGLTSVKLHQRPRSMPDKPEYATWRDYIKHTTAMMSTQVNKLLPLHDALDRNTLEHLFKVEDACMSINKYLEEPGCYFHGMSHSFTNLMYSMVGLSIGIEKKYTQIKAINAYRDKVGRIKLPFRYAYEYKLRDRDADKLVYNEIFLGRLRNVFILVFMIVLVRITFSYVLR